MTFEKAPTLETKPFSRLHISVVLRLSPINNKILTGQTEGGRQSIKTCTQTPYNIFCYVTQLQCLFTNTYVVAGRRPRLLIGKFRRCPHFRGGQPYAELRGCECTSWEGRDLELAKSRVRQWVCVRESSQPALCLYIDNIYTYSL